MDKEEKLKEIYDGGVQLFDLVREFPPMERMVATLMALLISHYQLPLEHCNHMLLSLFSHEPTNKSRMKKKLNSINDSYINFAKDYFDSIKSYAKEFDTTGEEFLIELRKKYEGEK